MTTEEVVMVSGNFVIVTRPIRPTILRKRDRPIDGRTDGRTDQGTDGRTDRPSYRDARTHLKTYGCYGANLHKMRRKSFFETRFELFGWEIG